MDAVNAASFWKPQARPWVSILGRARRYTPLEGSLKPGHKPHRRKNLEHSHEWLCHQVEEGSQNPQVQTASLGHPAHSQNSSRKGRRDGEEVGCATKSKKEESKSGRDGQSRVFQFEQLFGRSYCTLW